MIAFEASTLEQDLSTIMEWQAQDTSKSPNLPHSFWLTGSDSNPVTCRVSDEQGVLLYLRMDVEGSGLRMHTLFLPDSKEGRKRVATLLGNHFLAFAAQMSAHGDSITFESTSPSLVNYMMLLGFRSAGGNDYKLKIQLETVTVDCAK
jgi:hypothetical protein